MLLGGGDVGPSKVATPCLNTLDLNYAGVTPSSLQGMRTNAVTLAFLKPRNFREEPASIRQRCSLSRNCCDMADFDSFYCVHSLLMTIGCLLQPSAQPDSSCPPCSLHSSFPLSSSLPSPFHLSPSNLAKLLLTKPHSEN